MRVDAKEADGGIRMEKKGGSSQMVNNDGDPEADIEARENYGSSWQKSLLRKLASSWSTWDCWGQVEGRGKNLS
jgi:hypothetical protein